ncbi:MAG: DUF2244 domain-containing protein [Proteobacteria bacterium]|nr:DUF2244 domain-containing protein [Pseudomonadota bacterium]
MREFDPKSADIPFFSARLVAHRSLTPRGLAFVMGFVGAIGLAVSIPFFLMGAWPVAGFMGLDVALIYLAFRANNRAASAYEEILLSPVLLLVRSVSAKGALREMRFNPLWARLEREDHPEYGIERLALREGRRQVEIGACLGRAHRADLADALKKALGEAKR